MKQMVELTKYLKFLVVSSIFLIIMSCDSDTANDTVKHEVCEKCSRIITKEDSIIQLANELNIDYDLDKENINDILNKILITKNSLIYRLDSLDRRAGAMELAAIRYKKKEDIEIRNKLLIEINQIKSELDRIKELSNIPNSENVLVKEENAIPEIIIPDIATSFENLPSGNYVIRLDKYNIISIYVTPKNEIIVGSPKSDSTTIIKTSSKLDSRIAKELQQVREKFNKENQ